MAPVYELQYFSIRAVAEVSRLLFAAAGVKYTDTRFDFDIIDGKPTFSASWLAVRGITEKFAFAKLPVLLVDGQSLSQSGAINRYLAKQFSLLGSNDIEAALIESVIDQIQDLRLTLRSVNESERAAWLTAQLPAALSQFEAFALRHGGRNGIVGNTLSLADIYLSNWIFTLSEHRALVDGLVTAAPTVAAAVAAANAQSGIAAWIATRPVTAM